MNTNPDPYQSTLFRSWYQRASQFFTVQSVEIQSVDYCTKGDRIEVLFLKFKAELVDSHGQMLTQIFFLRGSSVALLVVLSCEGIDYAVLVKQVRPAIGGACYPELPAGMVENENIQSAALRELAEETGITVSSANLVDLCERFYGGAWDGVYPSPGACDEIVHLFLVTKTVDSEVIRLLQGKQTGNLEENEQITLELVELKDLCVSTPDPKTHSAFVMYETLKQKGDLP